MMRRPDIFDLALIAFLASLTVLMIIDSIRRWL